MFSNLKDIYAIVGANFGDEGKGMATAYFAGKDNALVVLHNGGCQRGHTVIDKTNGYRHVFHHFGSATLNSGDTYCASTFLVNPAQYVSEYKKLVKNGYHVRCYINKDCYLTTPYDMLINQIVEIDRGGYKHGSCGWGIFETLYRNHAESVKFKDKLLKKCSMTVKEFSELSTLDKIDFLDYLRKVYLPLRLNEFGLKKDLNEIYTKVVNSDAVIINYIDDFNFMYKHSFAVNNLDSIVHKYEKLIFENGQGLLLDQNNMDYYPHLTPSNTGLKNVVHELDNISCFASDVHFQTYYISRTYLTRHGSGRFDTECPKKEINAKMWDETNIPNPWQDNLRYGKLDSHLLERCADDYINNKVFYKCSFPTRWDIVLTHFNEYPIFDFNLLKKVKYISDKEGQFIEK